MRCVNQYYAAARASGAAWLLTAFAACRVRLVGGIADAAVEGALQVWDRGDKQKIVNVSFVRLRLLSSAVAA